MAKQKIDKKNTRLNKFKFYVKVYLFLLKNVVLVLKIDFSQKLKEKGKTFVKVHSMVSANLDGLVIFFVD